MDEVFPLIKALYTHLNFSGAIANKNFENDLKYLTDFIKAKIHN